ncbi:MAG: ABC transporter permease, partial [Steroidobacteraceae bacterium]
MMRAQRGVRWTLWAASVRHLLRRPAQLALALIGLALGVAAIVAVDIATASAGRAFELSMSAVSGSATHEITGGPAGVDERIYAWIAAHEPQLAAVPLVEGYVTVDDEALQLIGTDPFAAADTDAVGASALGGLDRLRRWLTEPGAVVMAAGTAHRLGLAVGQRFGVSAGGRPLRAVLIGVDAGGQPGRGSLLLTDIAQAQ